jgi:hypothetical protein
MPVYVIKSELLPCTPTTFYFRMLTETGSTEHLVKFEATLHIEFRMDIEIGCEKNCQDKVNPSRKLVLKAYCGNCMDMSEQFTRQIKYHWTSLDPALNLSALRTPGTDSTLIIAEDKLNMSSNYTFLVTGDPLSHISLIVIGKVLHLVHGGIHRPIPNNPTILYHHSISTTDCDY